MAKQTARIQTQPAFYAPGKGASRDPLVECGASAKPCRECAKAVKKHRNSGRSALPAALLRPPTKITIVRSMVSGRTGYTVTGIENAWGNGQGRNLSDSGGLEGA